MLISLLHSQHEDWPLLLGIARKTRRKHARPPLLLSFACHHGNLCQTALCASRVDAQYTMQLLHRSFAHSLNFSEIIAQRILRQQSRLLRADGKYIAQKWQPYSTCSTSASVRINVSKPLAAAACATSSIWAESVLDHDLQR